MPGTYPIDMRPGAVLNQMMKDVALLYFVQQPLDSDGAQLSIAH